MILKRCRNLETLKYTGDSTLCAPASKFLGALSADPWVLPQLGSLYLSFTDFQDENLPAILKQMNRLNTVKATGTPFSPLLFHELAKDRWFQTGEVATKGANGQKQRLCDFVETPWIDMCLDITSTMIQTLLESCPNMNTFISSQAKVIDVVFCRE
ncbi:hypothetical protein EDD21DRAFT_414145 [Dissophora ornata]|nr:hypothetical protein EDD21DRAFT_414145 [Dissophora ornata]